MSIKIAIASGKGGTGKTTVSVNLFHFIKENITQSVQLVDCDVEEPNDAIFFPNYQVQEVIDVNQLIPTIDHVKCTYCRKCVEYCEFNAIVIIASKHYADVNPALCHSCGACAYICPENAIEEKAHLIGEIQPFNNSCQPPLLEGRLVIGSPMQTMVIKDLVNSSLLKADIQLLDAPPGTSCPVVATLSQTDYTILVTEPSPFGLHDLKLMIELLHEIKQPFGVVINKADDQFPEMEEYLLKSNIEVIGKIPFSTNYAYLYAQGKILQNISEDIQKVYEQILTQINSKVQIYA
ncbi:P-loop NTPase [Carboxylicivirga sp. N1Y90]|uniref:nucleotide-binding protein n=1 Tax=Carboxylicivirga fragile TaxID=3417571 RepID=UPI003D358407|nr:ATP-binding protein [Marinilabiliaceae bacterium N1Y90]